MEYLLIYLSPYIIFLFIGWLFKRNNKNKTSVNTTKQKYSSSHTQRITKSTLKTKSPKIIASEPAPKPKAKLTDEEIRQRFEEKYRNTDFPASNVSVIQDNITHCPSDGTVLFNANVIYSLAWYKHIKCCPQCSHAFIEELTPKTVDFRNNKTILWVCKYQQTCNQRKHATTTVTGILFRGDSIPFNQVEVTIQYCYACNEYFISDEQFDIYRKRHPHLLGNFVFVSSLQNRGISLNLKDQESKLHLNGYNVSQKDNLNDNERHCILAFIIQKDILRKSEVIYYLSMFINRAKNKANMQKAVSKWNNDLNWVTTYDFDNQPKVWIDGIKHK